MGEVICLVHVLNPLLGPCSKFSFFFWDKIGLWVYVGGKGSKPLPMPTPSSYYALKLDSVFALMKG
jgi:hypothetical protein